MNVLVVCDEWPWPPHQGDRVRLAAICQVLADSHRVTIASASGENEGHRPSTFPAIRLDAQRRLGLMVLHPRIPATVSMRWDPGVRQRLNELAVGYDRVLFNQMKTTAWLDIGLDSRKVVVDLTDSLALYYRRRGGWFWNAEARRALGWEQRLAAKYCVVVSSEHDRRAIDPLGRFRVIVAANGYWLPSTPIERAPEPNAVIAVGNWDYYPNREGITRFVSKVWPTIRKKRRDATLWVIGRGTRPIIAGDLGVNWVGEVDDLKPWYGRCQVAVAPVYVGSGMKTKIMEALFYGVPMVATAFAVEGIEPNPMLLAVRDDVEFSLAVTALLDDPKTWDPVSSAQFMRRNSWDQTLAPLLQAIDQGGL